MSDKKIIGRIDGFAQTVCPRCKRPSLGTCAQCIMVATMIVESVAVNLSVLPPEALKDASTDPVIVSAVEAARIAFHTAPGMTTEMITKLQERIEHDVREGLGELDTRTTES